ncbi:ISKra4 family transposase, partial [Microcoleus sp. herbarium19]
IKRIGLRVKLSGAQWNIESVSSILSLRCAYLNGQLST